MEQSRILIIYTGGTIGMIRDSETGSLVPFTLDAMLNKIPTIRELGIGLEAVALKQVIDSSNMTPEVWAELAEIVSEHYAQFDGFVILHGSDTMAYTASALGFMLDGLAKPVILTGSQLPIGLARTDARENLITSLVMASMREGGKPLINEVCVFFEDKLFRGNRTHKFNSENFDAFRSVNYPVLADAGVRLKVHTEHLLSRPNRPFKVQTALSRAVGVIQLFPGIDIAPLADFHMSAGTRGIILETYGSGNGPSSASFLESLKKMDSQGILMVNITQCRGGRVEMEKYATGRSLTEAGVISGRDMTLEAALTKLMHVLATTDEPEIAKVLMQSPLSGEMIA